MKRAFVLVAVLCLAGCQAFNSEVDDLLAAQNLANVQGITKDNEELGRRAGLTPDDWESYRLRNLGALEVAQDLVESSER